MAVGVLALQGDVSEHYEAVKRAVETYKFNFETKYVKRKEDMKDVTHLIIPGGESTTISRLMIKNGLYNIIRQKAFKGELAVMGTCAGSILMAKKIVDDSRVKPLGLMDIDIRRNAFGRQRESFEADIEIEGIGKYHAVFIRAPIIEKCYGECKVLAGIDRGIVMAKQGKFIALVFHPELTEDTRIYREFLKI